MQHHQWIRLDPTDLELPHQVELRGVLVSIQLMPSDIPNGVRGFYDAKRGRFRIDFRYPDEDREPSREESKDVMTVITGRYSGRVQSLLIDTEATNRNAVMLAIESAELPESDHLRLNERKNRELIEQVLHSKARDIAFAT